MCGFEHHNAIAGILAIIGIAAVLSYLVYVYLDARHPAPCGEYRAIMEGDAELISVTADLATGTWTAAYDGRVTRRHESAECALSCARASRARLAA